MVVNLGFPKHTSRWQLLAPTTSRPFQTESSGIKRTLRIRGTSCDVTTDLLVQLGLPDSYLVVNHVFKEMGHLRKVRMSAPIAFKSLLCLCQVRSVIVITECVLLVLLDDVLFFMIFCHLPVRNFPTEIG